MLRFDHDQGVRSAEAIVQITPRSRSRTRLECKSATASALEAAVIHGAVLRHADHVNARTAALGAPPAQLDQRHVAAAGIDERLEVGVALARGDRVELRGFGAFTMKQRAARTGRNPRTGEAVSVAAKAVPHFRASREMIGRLNRRTDPSRRPG